MNINLTEKEIRAIIDSLIFTSTVDASLNIDSRESIALANIALKIHGITGLEPTSNVSMFDGFLDDVEVTGMLTKTFKSLIKDGS